MPFWLDIADFALKALIIVAALDGPGDPRLPPRRARAEPKDREIKVRSLNERYDDMRDASERRAPRQEAAQGAF